MESEIKKIQKFTDLIVWQEGHKLVLLIYKYTKKFPTEEKFSLTDQIRRAVVSITSNIAEGFCMKSSKEKNQYYNRARGSLVELQNQLLIAKDIGYLSKEDFITIANESVIVHRLINGLLRSTRLKKYER